MPAVRDHSTSFGAPRRRAAQILASLCLFGLLVLPCIAGYGAAYLALGSSILGALFVGSRQAIAAALGDWGMRMLLLAFAALSLAFALTARGSEDLQTIVNFIALPLALSSFVLFSRFASPRSGLLIAVLAFFGAASAAGWGVYETRLLGFDRASGNSSPIFFSDLGLFLGFFALVGLLVPGPRWRFVLLLGPLFGIAAALLGGTRGALLLLLFLGPLGLGFVLMSSREGRGRKLAGAGLALLIALGASLTLVDASRFLAVPRLVQEAVSGGQTSDVSANFRLQFYRAGLQAFTQSPLVGHGWWHLFDAATPFMAPEAAAQGLGQRNAHLHNDVLNFGVGGGLLGLGAYLLLILAPLVSTLKGPPDSQRRGRLYAGACLTLGFFAMGLTDSMFVYELPKIIFCLLAGMVPAFLRDSPARA